MKRVLICISVGLFILLASQIGGPFTAFALTQEQINSLQSEEAQLEKENTQLSAQKATLESQNQSIQRDINLLDVQIKQAQLQIQEKNIQLEQLGQNISQKSSTLSDLEDQLSQNQATLSALLRKANEQENISLVELLASKRPLSDIFAEADAEETLKQNINTVMESTKNLASSTVAERTDLQNQQNAATDAKQAIQTQQNLVKSSENQKAQLLKANTSQANVYQTIISNNNSRIAQIKSALFQLSGTSAIKFQDAFAYAENAQAKTGVDPAFTLAIIKQESNLGQNVGNCYLRDYGTGAGVSAINGAYRSKVMSPTRDIPPFLKIAAALGFDPQNQKISCPLSIGWGGAMGPAQFIPSTWVLPNFQAQISAALGTSVSSPWDPRAAIMASAIYLSNLGATGSIGNNYTTNRTAACHYYSGQNCYTSSGRANVGLSYGNSVMNIAECIQECDIDIINGVSTSCSASVSQYCQ